MLDKIKQILITNNKINGYKISEKRIEANELFFIGKNVDMDRAKVVHNFKVTVYKDIEENDNKYKGSSTTNIHPTMSGEEIKNAINQAAFAAQYVKNPYYSVVKPSLEYEIIQASNFSEEELPYWITEITNAIYKNDKYEKGGINSCEVFLNKVYSRIVNSEGIDVTAISYEAMVEFITNWKEEGEEEIELYRCLKFSGLNSEELSQEVENMINICKEKAIAKNTPFLEKISVLLTGDDVKQIFSFYYAKSTAEAVYSKASTWKIGDQVQGQQVKGDFITMTLDPFLKSSTCSASFDEDGLALQTVTILEKGVLKRFISNSRYAQYLNVEPTGTINNMIVGCGSKTIQELKQEAYMEVLAFSDFDVNLITGNFCGEIRLAHYFDGEKIIPVSGGSISGNINELHQEIYLSKEVQRDNNFQGPKAIKLLKVTVSGIEDGSCRSVAMSN